MRTLLLSLTLVLSGSAHSKDFLTICHVLAAKFVPHSPQDWYGIVGTRGISSTQALEFPTAGESVRVLTQEGKVPAGSKLALQIGNGGVSVTYDKSVAKVPLFARDALDLKPADWEASTGVRFLGVPGAVAGAPELLGVLGQGNDAIVLVRYRGQVETAPVRLLTDGRYTTIAANPAHEAFERWRLGSRASPAAAVAGAPQGAQSRNILRIPTAPVSANQTRGRYESQQRRR